MKFYELKKARTELGLTQAELADVLGVSPNTIYRWESGKLPVNKIAENFIKYLLKSVD